MLIAKELFVVNSGISWQLLFDTHNILSYVCLGIMVLHLLMHAKYLVGVFKKLPSSGVEMKSAVCRFSAGAAAAVVLYTSLAVFRNFTEKQDITNEQYLPDKNSVSSSQTEKPTVISKPDPPVNESTVSESVDEKPQITESTVTESVPDNEQISESTTESISESTETTSPPTVEEYLSSLICTGCGKRCSLLHPRCGKGQMQAERAKEQYYQTYAG